MAKHPDPSPFSDRSSTGPGADRLTDARLPNGPGLGGISLGDRVPFVLPRGLKLDLTGDRARVEYDGDVEITADLGWRFTSIRAGGNLTVRVPMVYGDLLAGGVLFVTSDVESNGVLHGREVVLGDQNIRCRVISADERITIGAATLAAEVILAPEIRLDPRAQGRVTVIESYNERDATKIKGGFSLADYEDMFGNSLDFLGQRGLAPLPGPRPPSGGGGGGGARVPRHEVHWDSAPTPSHAATHAPTHDRPAATRNPFADPADLPTPLSDRSRAADPRQDTPDEDTGDPQSMSIEDMEALSRRRRANDELQVRLVDALERIVGSYVGAEIPPPVHQLRAFIEQRDYDGLRANITEVWNSLLGFHQKRGIRPHHQVTHAFNVIHGLVQG